MAEPDTPQDKVFYDQESWHFPRGLKINNVPYNLDEKLSLYNWTPRNTYALRTALAKAKSGISRTIIALMGDSITAASSPALEPSTDSIAIRLEKALESKGFPIAGDGPVFPSNINTLVTNDNRWNVAASWGGSVLYRSTTTNGATATFTSIRTGTIVDIYYFNNNTGPFTYNIDGAGAVLVTPVAGTTMSLVSISGLADTTHSVVITTTTVTSTFMVAVAVRKASGLSIVNAGWGGSSSTTWLSLSWTNGVEIVKGILPNFVWYMIGVNDAVIAFTPLSTFKSNVSSTLNSIKTVCPIGLMIPPPISNESAISPYIDILYGIVDDMDIPLIDWRHHFVNYATFNGQGLSLDANHPNVTGLLDMGEMMASILT